MNLLHNLLRSLTLCATAAVLVPASAFGEYADAEKAYSKGDFVAAYHEYLALAQAGDARAQATVACMIQAGEGVSADPTRALPWLTKAAEKGVQPAQYSLGLAYEKGLGTRQDFAKALIWYGKAAERGDAKAQAGLKRLKTSEPVSAKAAPAALTAPEAAKGPALAVAQTATAAPVAVKNSAATVKTLNAPAPNNGAALSGQAMTEPVQTMPELIFGNRKIAAKRSAAEGGDVDAQVYLGWCYSTGKDVEQDKAEAIKWYRRAGEAGRVNAQTALGWLYFSGEAGKKDMVEAVRWYRKAAAQGDASAKRMLRRIEVLRGGL
jgi:uncharacterized protein